MLYEEVWKVLMDMLTEVRSTGETIPIEIMKDLRSAKTLMEILKANPERKENIPTIETYLGNVESYVFFVATEKLGSDRVDRYMERLEIARRRVMEQETPSPPRPIKGLPRKTQWIRIQVSEEIERGEIERLAKEGGLSWEMQEEGWVLVYGDGERIRDFLKRVAEKIRISPKKSSVSHC